MCLIGPNGAGKSTLLMAIAQLIKTDSAEIRIDGQKIDPKNVFSFRRRIAMVMQEPLLMDMTVFANVALPLRYRAWSKDRIEQQANTWLEKLGVLALRDRQARNLSGGEAQRVNLARAFAINPDLLLLDEPFSSLDAPTRAHLLEDLHDLLANTSVTTIFVTHELNEALLLGDRVAVLMDGRLRQIGSPQEVFNTPADAEVASFVGVETVIPGKVLTCQNGIVTIQANGFQLEAVGQAQPGRQVFFCLRPEDIILLQKSDILATASSARNLVAGKITKITPLGALTRVSIDCGFTMVALITRSSAQQMNLHIGAPISAMFKATAIHVIER